MDTQAIDDIWHDDFLSRRKDAEFMIQFLLGRIVERGARGAARSFVLSVEAGWGFGKSFFLDRLHKHLEASGYLVAHVNAWRDDHGDDPLMSVIAAIDSIAVPLVHTRRKLRETWNSVTRNGTRIASSVAKGALIHWAGKAVGDAAVDALANFDLDDERVEETHKKTLDRIDRLFDESTKKMLDNFNKTRKSIESFRSSLKAFVTLASESPDIDKEPPLFVLVDELDRCRPPYAIALLERIKHLFEIDNVVFVIACNTAELRHSIAAVYGTEFDSRGYLNRFFDRTYTFDEPDMVAFLAASLAAHGLDEEKVSVPPKSSVPQLVGETFRSFGFGLRDAEQCLDLIRTIATVWKYKFPIELVVLLPMVIGYHRGLDPALTPEFANELAAIPKKRTPPHTWATKITALRRGSRVLQKLVGEKIFSKFTEARVKNLPDLVEGSEPDWTEWVRDRFRAELDSYGGSYTTGSEPASILREYPSLVRTAGRLKQTPAGPA